MIEYMPDDTGDKKKQEMLQLYRNVFGTPEGRLVLGDILQMCHFGFGLTSDQSRVEYNVGIAIARMSGIMRDVDAMLGIKE